MTDHQNNDTPPQVRYDKELRALYQERNARSSFRTPGLPTGWRRHWYLQLFVMVVVVVSVSMLTTLSVLTAVPPLVPLLPFERNPKPTQQALELTDDLRHRLSTAVVSFLPARGGAGSVAQPYLAQESVGQGLALSSDGWLVTTTSVVGSVARTYQVASASGHLYPSELTINDPVAPFTFVKTSATNLTATPFAEVGTLSVGQPVAVAVLGTQSAQPGLYLRRLSHLTARLVRSNGEVAVSSETMPDRYLLDSPLPAGSQGAPVTTLKGEVIGLLADYDGQLRAVVPLDSLSSVIDRVFADHQVYRASLGVSYIQSAWLVPFVASGVAADGATVTAVKPAAGKTPAASALQVGDRILSVANERLTVRSLSSVLQQYRPGARLDLVVERAGREVKVSVTLGELVGKQVAAPKSGS